jgi:hypothetical protein
MESEIHLLVSGLADDHQAARDALVAVVKSEMPGAVVLDPSVPPDVGFELLLAAHEQVTPANLAELRQALVLELRRREVLHAELTVELLDETAA